MANPTIPPPTPPSTLGTLPTGASQPGGEDTFEQAGADGSTSPRSEDDDTLIDDGTPGGVEIGDPVPEKDRTVRAGGRRQFPDSDETGVDPDPNPSDERH